MFAYFIEVKRGIGSLPGPSWVPHSVRVTIPGILREFHFYGNSNNADQQQYKLYKLYTSSQN